MTMPSPLKFSNFVRQNATRGSVFAFASASRCIDHVFSFHV